MSGSFLLDLTLKSVFFERNGNMLLQFFVFSYCCRCSESYRCSIIFKSCFEEYRDANENAHSACENVLSVPGLTEKT